MSTQFTNRQWRLPNNENKAKQSNYSMDFDSASSDYIAINNNTTLNSISDSVSISQWIKFSGTSQQYITSFGNDYGTFVSVGKFYFVFRNTSNTQIQLASNSTINDGNWHHVVGVKTTSNITIYIDGALDKTDTTGDVGRTSTRSNAIGALYDGSINFNGQIDAVSIFDYALSSSQITTLYGSSSTGIGNPMSLSPKPVAFYQLGDKSAFNGANYLVPNIAAQEDDGDIATSYSPYALDFDGTNDYIDCGTGSRFNINQITISAWVNLSSGLTNTQIIAGIRNNTLGGGSICYQLQNQASGKFRFVISQSNGTYVDSVANDVHQYNTWYHVLGVADGSNIKLYINGNLQTIVSSYDGTIYSPNENFNIGRQSSPSNYYFDGKLSNVSVFNTGLTSSQVTEIYSEGVPSNLNNHSAYSNLVSWWQLGSNSSFNTNWTVLDEVTASGNNGTSVNMNEGDIVDGVGSYANGLSSGMGGDEVIGDAPYSTANALSVNMDVEDRVTDTPS